MLEIIRVSPVRQSPLRRVLSLTCIYVYKRWDALYIVIPDIKKGTNICGWWEYAQFYMGGLTWKYGEGRWGAYYRLNEYTYGSLDIRNILKIYRFSSENGWYMNNMHIIYINYAKIWKKDLRYI